MSLPEDFLAKVDKRAKAEYRSRSELIRTALRAYLKIDEAWDELRAIGRQKAKQLGITSEEQINDIVWRYRHEKD